MKKELERFLSWYWDHEGDFNITDHTGDITDDYLSTSNLNFMHCSILYKCRMCGETFDNTETFDQHICKGLIRYE